MDTRNNHLIFISGEPGSGKTYSCIEYMKNYRKKISTRAILIFNPGGENKWYQFREIKNLDTIPMDFAGKEMMIYHYPFPSGLTKKEKQEHDDKVRHIIANVKNCLCIVDDAASFIHKTDTYTYNGLRIRRNKNVDYIFMYHSPFDIPPFTDQFNPCYWLHRSALPLRERELPGILQDAQEKVNTSREKFPSLFLDLSK